MTSPAKRRERPKPQFAPRVTLRALRDTLGISVGELADRIAEHGGPSYDRSSISNFELGHQFMKPETRAAWEKALGLQPGAIILPPSNGNGHEDAA